MSDVKVFAINDCDWWAAETLEEAKADYLTWHGMTEPGDSFGVPFDDPRELTAEEMDGFRFNDEDGGITRSFREQLALMIANGEKFPTFFASTEY